MKKIFIIIFLLSLFNFINLLCYDDSDNYNASKHACLKRKPEDYETNKIGEFTPDTCCYVESIVKYNGFKKIYKECEAYDKKNIKKYLNFLKEMSKIEEDEDDDDKSEYKELDINCSSYYFKLGFTILLFIF